MQLTKAINRTAIVLAILALFPGGFIGLSISYYILNEMYVAAETAANQADIPLIWWKVLLYISGSLLGAGIAFFIVLFGIRSLGSFLKRLSLWVKEAFLNENN